MAFSINLSEEVDCEVRLFFALQRGVSRSWSFSGLATIVRIMLMYYIDVQGFLEHPEKDWEEALAAMIESPPEPLGVEKL